MEEILRDERYGVFLWPWIIPTCRRRCHAGKSGPFVRVYVVAAALLPYCIRSFVCAMVHGMDEHIGPWDVQNVLAFYSGKPARTRNGSIVDTVPFRPTRLVLPKL